VVNAFTSKLLPINTSSPIPTPPPTINVPVVGDVEFVVSVRVNELLALNVPDKLIVPVTFRSPPINAS